MNLDRYGASCRCLFRIWENLGNEQISESVFLAQHLDLFPEWKEQPGVADPQRLILLAQELGFATGGELLRDYERVLALHRAGNPVIVLTLRENRRAASDRPGAEQFALIMEMDETRFSLWAPASDGSAETISRTREEFWETALASGLVLYTPAIVEARS